MSAHSEDSFSVDGPQRYSSLRAEIRARTGSLYADDGDDYYDMELEDDISPDAAADIILEFPSPPSSTTSHSSYSRASYRDTYIFDNGLYTSDAVLQSYGELFRSAHRTPSPEEVSSSAPPLPSAWRVLSPWQTLLPRSSPKPPAASTRPLAVRNPVNTTAHVAPRSPSTTIEARNDRRRQAQIFNSKEVRSTRAAEVSSIPTPKTGRKLGQSTMTSTTPFLSEESDILGPAPPPKPLWLHRVPRKHRAVLSPSTFEPEFPEPPQVVQNMRLIHRGQAQRQFGARPTSMSTGPVSLVRSSSLIKRLRELPKKGKRFSELTIF